MAVFKIKAGPETTGVNMEDRWLSVDEIAAYIGIKRDTVYKWIGEKQMPAHRMGRLWKFRREEVDAWVKSGGAAEPNSRNSGTGNK
jgi:excisionase family DNA binding protein